ncbi:MAG: alcohol dehydrogenase catalytic domain-containing protein [bacterium]|nr:alcohol dehydrogenase catalytic domain-containing protein [bacterium]
MKALRCAPPGVALDQTTKPVPAANESLVRIKMAGICRTDLELTQGYMGFQGILGHEFVGRIDDPTSPWPQGSRVVGEINAGCGSCSWCRKGMERHCPHRSVLGIAGRDGCMAEWITLPHQNLYPVPAALSDQDATFVEPIAAALEIFEQIKIELDDAVCVIGDGKLGLLTALVFSQKHEGRLLLIGHHADKLQKIEDLVAGCLEDKLDPALDKTWDVVVEASGSTRGLQLAMRLVKPRGTIVLKTTTAHAQALDLTPIVIDEITVVGSRCGRFAPALSLLEKRPIPLSRLVDRVYPLEQAIQAWQHATTPGTLKILLQI